VSSALATEVLLNSTASLPARNKCDGPWEHGIRVHAYHIASKDASSGVTNKNAADPLGDIAFIFGGAGFPEPRGVESYYDEGIIEMNHISVSSWGDFLQCNHPDGSTDYTCKCPLFHSGGHGCDMDRAGQIQNSHSNGHTWYSFPRAGEGKYWDYEHPDDSRGCRKLQFHAQCVIDNLAQKAADKGKTYKGKKCSGKCSAIKYKDECAACVVQLSDTDKHDVWDKMVWDGGCSDLIHPEDPLNRRRSRRRHVKFGPTSGRSDEVGEDLEVDEESTEAADDAETKASVVVV